MSGRSSACAVLAAAALAGSVASAAGAGDGCAGGDIVPAAGNAEEVAAGLVCEMNLRRRAAGLAPLRLNARLSASAGYHAEDMVRYRYFAHRRPDGPALATRIRSTGYFRGVARALYTENLADAPEGAATPRSVVAAWMESEYHRVNMLTAPFRAAGVGVRFAPPDQAFYAELPSVLYVVDFGRRYWKRRPS